MAAPVTFCDIQDFAICVSLTQECQMAFHIWIVNGNFEDRKHNVLHPVKLGRENVKGIMVVFPLFSAGLVLTGSRASRAQFERSAVGKK